MGQYRTILGARLARMLALDAGAQVVEFHGNWSTWGQLAATADSVRDHIPGPGTRVGVLLRNSPAHVGLLTETGFAESGLAETEG